MKRESDGKDIKFDVVLHTKCQNYNRLQNRTSRSCFVCWWPTVQQGAAQVAGLTHRPSHTLLCFTGQVLGKEATRSGSRDFPTISRSSHLTGAIMFTVSLAFSFASSINREREIGTHRDGHNRGPRGQLRRSQVGQCRD